MVIKNNIAKNNILIKRINVSVMQHRSMFRKAVQHIMERNPSKIGRWPLNHKYAKESTAYGKSHYEVVDDSLAQNPTAEQDPYILTSQENVHKYDKDVTEVHKLSDKQAVSGKNKAQYGAWKEGSQKRSSAEYKDFEVERPTTPEEDEEFQKSRKKDPSAKTIYKRPPKDYE